MDPQVPRRTMESRSWSLVGLCFAWSFCLCIHAGAANALLSTEPSVWTCNFEEDEGFKAGSPPPPSHTLRLGGNLSVERGIAAQGDQFLRFAKVDAGDAFAIRLGSEASGISRRSLQFAVRFASEQDGPHLVMTHRQTVALKATKDGLEVSVVGMTPVRLGIGVSYLDRWIDVEFLDDSAAQLWELIVDGETVAAKVPSEGDGSELAGLLVLSDGAADLDALQFVYVSSPPTVSDGTQVPTSGHPDDLPVVDSPEQREWNSTLGQAFRWARDGQHGAAKLAIVAYIADHKDAILNSHLKTASKYSYLAYALRNEYHNEAAIYFGRAAIEETRLAQKELSLDVDERASAAFSAGGIYERILADPQTAELEYRRALALIPDNRVARKRLQRLERHKVVEPGENAALAERGQE